MHTVVINEGPAMSDDNASYFCKEEPVYEAVNIPVVNDAETSKFVVFLKFVPTNGRDPGKEHRVPVSRVVMVVRA